MFDKQLLLKDFLEPGDKLLFAKVLDRALFSIKHNSISFTDFLDPYKLTLFTIKLKSLNSSIEKISIESFGGLDNCERKIIALAPAFMNISSLDFPIKVIRIEKKADGELLHRHCLGSILALGIDRAKLGDIEISDDVAFVFAHSDIASFIAANLEKVSRFKVNASIVDNTEILTIPSEHQVYKITVASLRVDIIISSVFKMSRAKSKELIKSEKLFINWSIKKEADYLLKDGDVITLRGFGRVKFIKTLSLTKKDRLLIKLQKY